MKRILFLVLVSTFFLTGCSDPAANKEKATVSNSTPNVNATKPASSPAAEPSVPAGGMLYKITPENTTVGFTGSKVTGKHDGGFKQFSGSIIVTDKKVEAGKVTAEVDMTSVFSDAEKLTEHLKSADFFDVEKFPKATFTSSKIVADTAKGADNYTVTGELEFRGQKKTISFPAKIVVGEKNVEVTSEFSINRKDFGVVYAGKADDLIRDDVVIRITVK